MAVLGRCDRPPVGWVCSRQAGHDGPCAAIPEDGSLTDALLRSAEAQAQEVGEALVATQADLERLAQLALDVLDAERERTGIDEWDESDERCRLYNAAWAVVHPDA